MGVKTGVSAADAAAIAGVLAMASAAMGGGFEPANDVFPGDAIEGAADGAMIFGDLEDRGCGYGYGYSSAPMFMADAGRASARSKEAADRLRGGDGGFVDCTPDTTLGIFDEVGALLVTDDDGSFLGDGLASAVFGQDVGPAGEIFYAVSGFPDFDFDGLADGGGGPHGEIGPWEAYADYYDAGGGYIGTDFVDFGEFFFGDEVFFGQHPVPVDAATFDLYLDNRVSGECVCVSDVDFYCVGGLTPGSDYEVRVTDAAFDSVLGLFDASGALVDFNDDDPDAGCCLSVLTGTADGDGKIYLAVSGYFDEFFSGEHQEFGFYDLAVTPAGCPGVPGCNDADLAAPFGLLDLSDITTFSAYFLGGDCRVDSDGNGLLDLADINAFIAAFTGGCP